MDNWIFWEIVARQMLEEQRLRRSVPAELVTSSQPGLRRRLAALLVAAGVRLDAEASRAVLFPAGNHT